MNADDYLQHLQGLLPPGPAWTTDPGATFTKQLDAWAQELARIDARAIALTDEANPRTTDELLADWERVAGLPDSCVGPDQTVAQRRASLVAKLASLGGQTVAYYIAIAAALGFTITITEGHEHSVEDDVEDPLTGHAWAYTFTVNAPLNTVIEITVEDDVETALSVWGNQVLECVINRYKPAHTIALFAYS